MEVISKTALWVAGMRALESERAQRLFEDPFARHLAGEDVVAELRAQQRAPRGLPPAIEVRTRWLDDQVAMAMGRGLRQVVVLAAGMDARPYRLAWPPRTSVFELDRGEVLQYKRMRLHDAVPTCDLISVEVDLEHDWPSAIRSRGFDELKPTLWLIEGLLCYLTARQVAALLERIDGLSAAGSTLLADVLGQSMLRSAASTELLHHLATQFGTDEPEELLRPLGWRVNAHLIAAMGQQLGRWPFPVVPRGTPGVPQSFLVHAVKC